MVSNRHYKVVLHRGHEQGQISLFCAAKVKKTVLFKLACIQSSFTIMDGVALPLIFVTTFILL